MSLRTTTKNTTLSSRTSQSVDPFATLSAVAAKRTAAVKSGSSSSSSSSSAAVLPLVTATAATPSSSIPAPSTPTASSTFSHPPTQTGAANWTAAAALGVASGANTNIVINNNNNSNNSTNSGTIGGASTLYPAALWNAAMATPATATGAASVPSSPPASTIPSAASTTASLTALSMPALHGAGAKPLVTAAWPATPALARPSTSPSLIHSRSVESSPLRAASSSAAAAVVPSSSSGHGASPPLSSPLPAEFDIDYVSDYATGTDSDGDSRSASPLTTDNKHRPPPASTTANTTATMKQSKARREQDLLRERERRRALAEAAERDQEQQAWIDGLQDERDQLHARYQAEQARREQEWHKEKQEHERQLAEQAEMMKKIMEQAAAFKSFMEQDYIKQAMAMHHSQQQAVSAQTHTVKREVKKESSSAASSVLSSSGARVKKEEANTGAPRRTPLKQDQDKKPPKREDSDGDGSGSDSGSGSGGDGNDGGSGGDDDPEDDDPDDPDNDLAYIDEENNEYTHYMPYFLKRERLFPLATNLTKYRGRYSLLTVSGREYEHWRFGFECNFDRRLYSAVYLRIYDQLRVAAGVARIGDYKRQQRSTLKSTVPSMIMTYAPADNHAGHKTDFDLRANSETLRPLPLKLRVHPSGHNGVYPAMTFGEMCIDRIALETYTKKSKFNKALQELKTARVAVASRDAPALEDEDGEIQASSSSSYRIVDRLGAQVTTVRDRQALQIAALKRTDAEVQAIALSALGEAIDILPIDLRGQLTAAINRSVDSEDTDRFTDKQVLKEPPKMDKKFDGSTSADAGGFIAWLCHQTTRYEFTAREFMTLAETNVTGRALTWFKQHQTEINSVDRLGRIRRFIELFNKEYMTQSHINQFENEWIACTLRSESMEAVDAHYAKYTAIVNNLRMCKPHVTEKEVMHRYYMNLPEGVRRYVTVSELERCTQMSDLYRMIRTAVSYTKGGSSGRAQPQQSEVMAHAHATVVAANALEAGKAAEKHEHKRRHKAKFKSNQSQSSSPSASSSSNSNSSAPSSASSAAAHTNKDWDKFDKQKMECFHCGERGHNKYACSAAKAGRPQNALGRRAHSDYLARSGMNYDYKPPTFDSNGNPVLPPKYHSSSGGRGGGGRGGYYGHGRGEGRGGGQTGGASTSSSTGSGSKNAPMHVNDNVHRVFIGGGDEVQAVEVKMNYTMASVSERAEIDKLIQKEKTQAHLLGLHIKINGVNSFAMVDQGCTCVIARHSYVELKWPAVAHSPLPAGSRVTGSTGVPVPMKTCIKVDIQVGKTIAHNQIIFIVDDKQGQDICADMILGKTFLDNVHAVVDMNKNKMIMNGQHTVALVPACTEATLRGERWCTQLVLQRKSAETAAAANATVSVEGTGGRSRRRRHKRLEGSNMQPSPVYGPESAPTPPPVLTDTTMQAVAQAIKKLETGDDNAAAKATTPVSPPSALPSTSASRRRSGSPLSRAAYLQRQEAKLAKKEERVEQIIAYTKAWLDKDATLTDAMRELVLENVVENAGTLTLMDKLSHHALTQSPLEHALYSIDVDVEGKQTAEGKKARMTAYLNALNAVPAGNKHDDERKLLVQQIVSLPFEAEGGADAEDDEAMSTAESIDDLGPTPIIPDTPAVREERRQAVVDMVNNNNNIDKQQKQKLIELLTGDKWMKVLSLKGENFKQTSTVQHEINTEVGARPFRQKLRSYSIPLQKIIDAEVDRMIKEGMIVPSNSPYASNLLLVRKPDASSEGGIKNRVCVNFIQLNKQTIKDAYPMANANVMFNDVARARWFSTCDLMNGYWQVAIKPEHRHKTAFITKRGLYEFVVMAFGLCNAPGTFQRLMDEIILPQYRDFIQSYVDDLITYSNTFDDHIKHLDVLAGLLLKHELTVKLKKCWFAQREIKFLGHLISEGRIKPNPEKVSAISNIVKPTNVKGVRSFVSSVGWYRRFIPNFAETAAPLFELTKKGVEFLWTKECQRAFDILKQKLIEEPVLRTADPNKDYWCESDASDKQIAMTLLQEDDDGKLHPIAYASKTLDSAQRNYTTSQKECLALVWGLEHFNLYLEGHKYTCLADHKALEALIGVKESSCPRLTRWVMRLQPYHLKVQYIKGVNNPMADMLSRTNEMMEMKANSIESTSSSSPSSSSSSSSVSSASSPKSWLDGISAAACASVVSFGHVDAKQVTATIDEQASIVHAYTLELCSGKEVVDSVGINAYLASTRGPTRDTNAADAPDSGKQTGKSPRRLPKYRKRTSHFRGEYEVEAIVGKRVGANGKHEYKVEWHGTKESTWEPIDNLSNCMNKVMEYERGKIALDVLDDEEKQRLPATYVCDVCEKDMRNQSAYHIHRYWSHNIAMPRLATELGIVEAAGPEVVRVMQQTDKSLAYIFDSKLGTKIIDTLPAIEKQQLAAHEFVMSVDGVLYVMDVPTVHSRARLRANMKLVVPRPMRDKILKEVHNGVMSGHSGITNMIEKLCEYVWWPKLRMDVIRFVNTCDVCQRSKRHAQHTHLSRAVAIPTAPFSRIGVDVIGPLPATMGGNVYILTVVDHLTRYAEAFAMAEADTKTISNLIIKHIICRHGLFDVMVSDQGGPFVSALAKYIYTQLGIEQKITTAYHPQANGVTERFNGTLKQLLKVWCNEEQDDWDDLLHYAVFVYNTNYHRVVQEVPFFAKEGRMPKLPLDIIIGKESEKYSDAHQYADELVQRLRRVQSRIVELYQSINEERTEDIEDIEEDSYEVNEMVWLYDPTTKPGKSTKLTHRWIGPAKIITKKNDLTFIVELKDGSRKMVHKNRLRKYMPEASARSDYLTAAKDTLQEELEAIKTAQLALLRKEKEKKEQLELLGARAAVTAVASEPAAVAADAVVGGVN